MDARLYRRQKVVDLGTGTGIFAIGAVLLGAKEVVAVEKDEDAIQIAKQNAENLGVESEIKFIKSDIEDFESTCDTVVMNPPFSVHSDIDIGFIQKAIELGDSVYSVSHPGARKSIKDFVANSDHVLEALRNTRFRFLRPTVSIQRKTVKPRLMC